MGNGNSSTMMILLFGGCGLCVCSICAVVGLYFFYEPFKTWVNNLFGGSDGCVRDDSISGAIKYDAGKCANKCLFVGGNNTKVKLAKDGAWTDAKQDDCPDYVLSPDAGQEVCPTHIGGRATKNTVKTTVGSTTWCGAATFPSTVISKLPDNAVAGRLYGKVGIDGVSNGVWGPNKGGYNKTDVWYLAR